MKTNPDSLPILTRCGTLVGKVPNDCGHAVRHALNTLAGNVGDGDAKAIRIYEKIIELDHGDREAVLSMVESMIEPAVRGNAP